MGAGCASASRKVALPGENRWCRFAAGLKSAALFAFVGISLAGCSLFGSGPDTVASAPEAQRPISRPHYKVGNPYQVSGVWYYPAEDQAYDQTGIASWYGPGFDGKLTANGEIFDQNRVSAAHPTLPMPIIAQVTNLENGRSIAVRVNDRGPFAHGREIDLSKRAAELLGFVDKGTAKVRVQYLGPAPLSPDEDPTLLQSALNSGNFVLPKPTTPETERQVASAPVGGVTAVEKSSDGERTVSTPKQHVSRVKNEPVVVYEPLAPATQPVEVRPVSGERALYVQAGAFSDKRNAEEMRQELSSLGKVQLSRATVDGIAYYRVRLGPLPDVASADQYLETVVAKGHSNARIIVD